MPPTDPEESVPDPLPEVPMAELLERARSVATNESLMDLRGEIVAALRARGMQWRQIEAETGMTNASARRWMKLYLEKQQ